MAAWQDEASPGGAQELAERQTSNNCKGDKGDKQEAHGTTTGSPCRVSHWGSGRLPRQQEARTWKISKYGWWDGADLLLTNRTDSKSPNKDREWKTASADQVARLVHDQMEI